MAKNSNSQGHKIKASKQHQAGTVGSDQMYTTQYDQGHDAFRNGYKWNPLWSAPKKAGWKKARDIELKFLVQQLNNGGGATGSKTRLSAVGIDIAA